MEQKAVFFRWILRLVTTFLATVWQNCWNQRWFKMWQRISNAIWNLSPLEDWWPGYQPIQWFVQLKSQFGGLSSYRTVSGQKVEAHGETVECSCFFWFLSSVFFCWKRALWVCVLFVPWLICSISVTLILLLIWVAQNNRACKESHQAMLKMTNCLHVNRYVKDETQFRFVFRWTLKPQNSTSNLAHALLLFSSAFFYGQRMSKVLTPHGTPFWARAKRGKKCWLYGLARLSDGPNHTRTLCRRVFLEISKHWENLLWNRGDEKHNPVSKSVFVRKVRDDKIKQRHVMEIHFVENWIQYGFWIGEEHFFQLVFPNGNSTRFPAISWCWDESLIRLRCWKPGDTKLPFGLTYP